MRKACALTRTLVLSGPYFSAVVSKTVGRRVLGVCIAFSGSGRRPSDGRLFSRNGEKIRRGRATEKKEGTWKETSILLVHYWYRHNCEFVLTPEYFLSAFTVYIITLPSPFHRFCAVIELKDNRSRCFRKSCWKTFSVHVLFYPGIEGKINKLSTFLFQEVTHVTITLATYARCWASRNGDEDLHNFRNLRYPGHWTYARTIHSAG